MTTPHELIIASAGSGKTHTLTTRYVAALLDQRGPAPIASIFAATFTRAAAGEIVDRVLARLAAATLDPDERARLARELGVADLTRFDRSLEQSLLEVSRSLARLFVCTIDSFIVRAATCFAPELGLSQPWQILDDVANEQLCAQALNEVLREHLAPGRFMPMADLLVRFAGGDYKLSLRGSLWSRLTAARAALVAGPREAWERLLCEELETCDVSTLRRMGCELRTTLAPHTPARQRNRFVKLLHDACEALGTADDEGLLQCRLLRLIHTGGQYYNEPIPPAWAQALRPAVNHVLATALTRLHQRNLATRDLLEAFEAAAMRIKRQQSAYRYDDFTRLLLEASIPSAELDEFYFRMDGRIRHILLDEFQDTSLSQWRVLEPLLRELAAGDGGHDSPRSFLVVGDPKQTLYGWREAEPGLIGLVRTLCDNVQVRELVRSFRSAPVVIEAVNTLFGNLTANPNLADEGGPYSQAAAAWMEGFKPHEAHNSSRPGYVTIRTSGGDPESRTGDDRLPHLVAAAADVVAEIAAADPQASIGILVRTNGPVASLLYHLQRRGLLASGEGGNPLIDDPAVCAVLAVMQLLDHPGDGVARAAVEHSPLMNALGLSDSDALRSYCERLRQSVATRGMAASLALLLPDIAAHCDVRNLARLRQLVDQARAADQQALGPARFVRQMMALPVEEPTSARIKVMTIHKSKGLEFDHVVVLDLEDARGRASDPPLVIRPALNAPADLITLCPDEATRALFPHLQTHYDGVRARQIVGELCALYVAITRPRFGLTLIVHPQNRTQNGRHRKSLAGVVLDGLKLDGLKLDATRPDTIVWTAPGSTPRWSQAYRIADQDQNRPRSQVLTPVVPPAPPGPLTIDLRPAADRLLVVSPSRLEGGARIDLRSVLRLQRDASLDRGTVLHAFFESITWLDDGPPDHADLRRIAAEHDVAPPHLEALLTAFAGLLRQPNLCALLTRTPADRDAEVWRERRFTVPLQHADGRPFLLNGVFDRLVIRRDASGRVRSADVIDYKTDAVTTAEQIARRVETYRPQILAYRVAAATLLDCGVELVRCRLVFAGPDRVIEIDPTSPGGGL